jgi:hypothetical protein
MEKIRKNILRGVVASETIHVFCCGFPTLFSILSLLSGFGLIYVMPNFMYDVHNLIHSYEAQLIGFSALMLMIGWGTYILSKYFDCRTEGSCHHEPCEPKKDRTKIFMIVATLLFIGNFLVYFLLH